MALLLGLSLFVAVLAPGSVDGGPPPPPVTSSAPAVVPGGFATGAGLLWADDATVRRDLDAMAAAGADWVRFDFDWPSIEPVRGRFDWRGPDRLVREARARGLSVIGLLTYSPAWARAPGTDGHAPPSSDADFAGFARAATARYPLGQVGVWEIWNEPNHSAFWSPRPDARRYVGLLRAASTAIHAVAPGAVVLSGGLSPYGSEGDVAGSGTVNPVTFVRQMYAAGAAGSFDALAAHPYSAPVSPLHVAPWNAFQQLPRIHDLMAANGDGAKEIWSTEYGAPTRGEASVTERTQAAHVRQAFWQLRQWPWAGPLLWYSHRDRGTDTAEREDWFGLRRHGGRAKPGLLAYRRAVGALR